MNIALTIEQQEALWRGQRVVVTIGDEECVLIRKEVFQQLTYDASPWTPAEMDSLAQHALDSADNPEPIQ